MKASSLPEHGVMTDKNQGQRSKEAKKGKADSRL
jgi:hypothetical protein